MKGIASTLKCLIGKIITENGWPAKKKKKKEAPCLVPQGEIYVDCCFSTSEGITSKGYPVTVDSAASTAFSNHPIKTSMLSMPMLTLTRLSSTSYWVAHSNSE